jgi:peptidyl-prolyl cis-trans isomerase B (cyclophilin B)
LALGGFVDALQQSAVAEEAAASSSSSSSSSPEITKKVFMDVAIDGQPIGQIVVGLYGDAVPVGAQRFSELAAGKRGIGYRRKEFYKIAKNYVQNVGVRGFSLTGGTEDAAKFTGGDTADALVDEMVQLDEQRRRPKHVRWSVSLVALDPTRPPPKSKLVAKDGTLVVIEEQARPPPNGTEFMIATAAAPELDQTNTVVGQVIQGMDVLDRIHSVKVVNENSSSPYFQ